MACFCQVGNLVSQGARHQLPPNSSAHKIKPGQACPHEAPTSRLSSPADRPTCPAQLAPASNHERSLARPAPPTGRQRQPSPTACPQAVPRHGREPAHQPTTCPAQPTNQPAKPSSLTVASRACMPTPPEGRHCQQCRRGKRPGRNTTVNSMFF